MNLYQYIALSNDAKSQLLWEQGIYVMNRFEDDLAINLYMLSDFYVEAWYNQNSNKIVKLRPFRSLNLLETYLNQIKLNI
ncbi:MAG: hypothetical protein IH597_08785 [Bacteroidales bacterium]|nr:hypothetical protein [Bacteroidales bacterium]